jgi:type IV secretion system protein VirD4
LSFDGSSHLITIAPTGSGKGVNSIIPNLLNYKGPIISLDPKGEQVRIVKEKREKMGHRVVVLDPFNVTPYISDGFNVMDISSLSTFDAEDDSYCLAHEIIGSASLEDPFWDNHSKMLIGGLLNYYWQCKPKKEQHLGNIRGLFSEDLAYTVAVILDTQKDKISKASADALAGYLILPSDKTRPCVDGTAVQAFSSLFSQRIETFMKKSTFDINDVVAGKPLDIFIVFPPDKLKSHSRLLRMIFSVLFKAITSRTEIPEKKTLIVLDECAALEKFDYMESMIALCRGYGAIIHTVWQDLAQVKRNYKEGFSTILNNSGAWQIFGANKYNMATEIAEITGVPIAEILAMGSDDQVLFIDNKVYNPAKRLNYLKDQMFAGMYSPNPFHNNSNDKTTEL